MKKSMVTRTSGKLWTAAGGLVLALLLADMNPAAAQNSSATQAAIATLKATMPARVVQFAGGMAKHKIKVGRGECTDLVDAALKSAMAKPGNNYVWGTLKRRPAMGDIIQFEGCYFEAPGKTRWFTMEHHTAIVESASGSVVTLLHQNAGGDGATRRDTLDLSWLKRGSYKIYAPVFAR
jgi:hypothetical protein